MLGQALKTTALECLSYQTRADPWPCRTCRSPQHKTIGTMLTIILQALQVQIHLHKPIPQISASRLPLLRNPVPNSGTRLTAMPTMFHSEVANGLPLGVEPLLCFHFSHFTSQRCFSPTLGLCGSGIRVCNISQRALIFNGLRRLQFLDSGWFCFTWNSSMLSLSFYTGLVCIYIRVLHCHVHQLLHYFWVRIW